MSGETLDDIIRECSVNYEGGIQGKPPYNLSGHHFPLPVPGNEYMILDDDPNYSLVENFDLKGRSTCPYLKLVGFQGLRRSGLNPDPKYKTGVVRY